MNSNQIQKMIDRLKKDESLLKTFCTRLEKINSQDRAAIMTVLKEGHAELFNRYDSSISEQFVKLYENLSADMEQKEECSQLITAKLAEKQEELQNIALEEPDDFERELYQTIQKCVKKVYGEDVRVEDILKDNTANQSAMQNMGRVDIVLPDGSVSFCVQFTMPAALTPVAFENDSLEPGAWEREVEQFEAR